MSAVTLAWLLAIIRMFETAVLFLVGAKWLCGTLARNWCNGLVPLTLTMSLQLLYTFVLDRQVALCGRIRVLVAGIRARAFMIRSVWLLY